jgi:tRNA threonylcarbamoyladenosine biosynthesis protein TsaB
MNLLAIDTAASLCAACVLDTETGKERGRAVLDLGTGHAEHLIGVVEEALERAGIGHGHLEMVAVSIGPGSFTGVRVGVSAARGFALALKIPAVGVSTLEALAAEGREAFPGLPVLAFIDAGRGGVYAAGYGPDGAEEHEASLLGVGEAGELVRQQGTAVLAGSGAEIAIAEAGRRPAVATAAATADIATYARLASARGLPGRPASPLYLRAADAKPQQGFALPRKVVE